MELIEKIIDLKNRRNAVILAHNYQGPEVQDIADFVGDSLGLSVEASRTKADVIMLCGVYFMAETAKILCPDKTVLIPDARAGCPMADMIDAEDVKKLKAKHPQAMVLCYVNTTASVKAECDVCCTSANAVKIATEVIDGGRQVIFIPDQHLGYYVSRRVKKDFVLWSGYCPTHARIFPDDIMAQKQQHPNARVIVHPECLTGVADIADEVLSTGGMCAHVKGSDAGEFIVGTEEGILHRLRKENPGKIFYQASRHALCPNMKLTTLEKILWAFEDMEYEVRLDPSVAEAARQSIERMFSY